MRLREAVRNNKVGVCIAIRVLPEKPSGTEVSHFWAIAIALQCSDNGHNRGESGDAGFHNGRRTVPDGGHMESSDRYATRSKASEVHPPEAHDLEEEARKIRRLQLMISMVMSVIAQDPNLSVEEAAELIANAKRAALAMFPDKELAFDILYKPRLQRLMRERFRLQ